MAQALITPEAVDSIFKNLTNCLPEYVSALPSIRKGLITTIIIIVIGIVLAIIVKSAMRGRDIISQSVWVVVILASIFVGGAIGDTVKDRDYLLRSISLNRQHFANTHWLKYYTKAMKLE